MRRRSVRYWAWSVSITVHLIVLLILAVTQLSQPKVQARRQPGPTARINRVKEFIQTANVIPKPKIKRHFQNHVAKNEKKTLLTSQIFDSPGPGFQDTSDLMKSSSLINDFSTSGSPPKGIEFFGSWTDQRKICYLVDCSGSMQGMFGRVREKLADSVGSLQQDQYFSIIFFGAGRLYEFNSGHLVRATQKNKSGAYDFIGSVQAAGQTNATEALERAVKIRDSSGLAAQVIYFLTDGFELTGKNEGTFSLKAANLLNSLAPGTIINTIGFWPSEEDRQMLEAIAGQSGGKAVFIVDGVHESN